MDAVQTIAFSALAEPTRLRIIDLLAQYGELSASEISNKFSSTASAISQHLKVLREARLVVVRKRAQKRLYQLNTDTMTEVASWAQQRAEQWNTRLDNMETYIQKLPKNNHK